MNTIAFHISNHGYGHAARNISIIKQMLQHDLSLKIIVKTSLNQINSMKQSLKKLSLRIAYYELKTDLGLILKSGNMSIDKAQLYDNLIEFISTWDTKIKNEKEFFEKIKLT